MNKFLILLPGNDEIVELVVMMAMYAKAEYQITRTLETDDEKLARAVAELTGQILTDILNPDRVRTSLPSPLQGEGKEAAGEGKGAEESSLMDDAWVDRRLNHKTGWSGIFMEEKQEMIEEPLPNPPLNGEGEEKPAAPTAGKVCKFCGEPIGPRGKICNKKECRNKKQKIYDAAWRAKKKATAASGTAIMPATDIITDKQWNQSGDNPESIQSPGQDDLPIGEAATPIGEGAGAAQGPLGETGIIYCALSGEMVGANFDFAELQKLILTGWLIEGDRIQARPSGKFYEIRGGALARAEEKPGMGIVPEAGPGVSEITSPPVL